MLPVVLRNQKLNMLIYKIKLTIPKMNLFLTELSLRLFLKYLCG